MRRKNAVEYPDGINAMRTSNAMKSKTVEIVDIGRGPQIAGHRLTVMDVFYYLRRGHDFDFMHRAMPSLTREQFEAVVEYVNDHHAELVAADRRVEDRIRRDIAEQNARACSARSIRPSRSKSGPRGSRRNCAES